MFLLYAFYDFKLILKVDVKKKVKSTSKMTEYLQQVLTLSCPSSPLLVTEPDSIDHMEHLLIGFDKLEEKIHYHFKDRSYLQ
jgi:hypothetical protein